MASSIFRRGLVAAQSVSRSFSTTGAVLANQAKVMEMSPEKFDNYFIDYMSRPEIDGWELRKALTELHSVDVIPDVKVIEASLRACRRLNDFGLTVRFLESLRMKCGNKPQVYAWLISEVKPVLEELGIPTLEEIGYDKPEFFVPDPDFWWEKTWYKDYGLDKMPGYKHFA
uniref:Cytochrome c oxidase subunit 5A, mitochondrial n=1 Tax=Ditylenchus dipsaci TaxID=166011 RepID=A0A915D4G4_9BILA